MSKPVNVSLSKDKVQMTVNLSELFDGADLSGNPSLREEIGQAIIDTIRERTEKGVSVEGKDFREYSDEYEESLAFKAYGKSENEVNLTQSGTMLDSLDVLETSDSEVVIGWDDPTENAKAYNHNVGDTVPRRPFFGITQKELEEIKDKYISEIPKKTFVEELVKDQEFQKLTLADVVRDPSLLSITAGRINKKLGDYFE